MKGLEKKEGDKLGVFVFPLRSSARQDYLFLYNVRRRCFQEAF